ncbi:MAG: hypothetical protein MJ016_08415, partial [Victivallaceae bacterium]|nr:hypothetical protein [Victivallaceae bacterium]
VSCRVDAVVNLPDFPADDPDDYASIHSNPPGLKDTAFTALSEHRFGKGRAVYLYSPVLTGKEFSHREFGRKLFLKYASSPLVEAENLPVSAEITFLGGGGEIPELFTVVNDQDDLPPVPLHDVRIALRLPGFDGTLRRVSDGKEIAFTRDGDIIRFTLERIDFAEFIELQRPQPKED